MTGLTSFQREVARVFFSLERSQGYLLAGGSALIANGLIDRTTRDLDFFGSFASTPVQDIVEAFRAAVSERGWQCDTVQSSPDFVRLLLTNDEVLVIDICIDSPPLGPPDDSFIGPTFGREELAGRKLSALFDRAEARDFADVFVLTKYFDKDTLLEFARQVDAGISSPELAEMMRSVARFEDHAFPMMPGDVPRLRDFFLEWADELDTRPGS